MAIWDFDPATGRRNGLNRHQPASARVDGNRLIADGSGEVRSFDLSKVNERKPRADLPAGRLDS